MTTTYLLIAGGVGLVLFILFFLLRRPKPTLEGYKRIYDQALADYRANPKDMTLKQEALRRGRAYYLQRAGQASDRERQYSIEAMLERDLAQTTKKTP